MMSSDGWKRTYHQAIVQSPIRSSLGSSMKLPVSSMHTHSPAVSPPNQHRSIMLAPRYMTYPSGAHSSLTGVYNTNYTNAEYRYKPTTLRNTNLLGEYAAPQYTSRINRDLNSSNVQRNHIFLDQRRVDKNRMCDRILNAQRTSRGVDTNAKNLVSLRLHGLSNLETLSPVYRVKQIPQEKHLKIPRVSQTRVPDKSQPLSRICFPRLNHQKDVPRDSMACSHNSKFSHSAFPGCNLCPCKPSPVQVLNDKLPQKGYVTLLNNNIRIPILPLRKHQEIQNMFFKSNVQAPESALRFNYCRNVYNFRDTRINNASICFRNQLLRPNEKGFWVERDGATNLQSSRPSAAQTYASDLTITEIEETDFMKEQYGGRWCAKSNAQTISQLPIIYGQHSESHTDRYKPHADKINCLDGNVEHSPNIPIPVGLNIFSDVVYNRPKPLCCKLDCSSNFDAHSQIIQSPLGESNEYPITPEELLSMYRNVCSEVIESIFVSADSCSKSLDILRNNKITHIINAAGETCKNCHIGRFHYLTLYLQDSRILNEAMDAILYHALDFIDSALLTSNQRILLHCKEGISRSSTIAVAYLMWSKEISFKEALEMIRKKREVCNPNTGFTYSLLCFGRRMATAKQALTTSGQNVTSSVLVERRLFRICPHHRDAPFLVVLGISKWDSSMNKWIPGDVKLDPRFCYVLRNDYQFYLCIGKDCTASKFTTEMLHDYLKQVSKFERVEPSVLKLKTFSQEEKCSEFYALLNVDEALEIDERWTHISDYDEEADIIASNRLMTMQHYIECFKRKTRRKRKRRQTDIRSSVISNDQFASPLVNSSSANTDSVVNDSHMVNSRNEKNLKKQSSMQERTLNGSSSYLLSD